MTEADNLGARALVWLTEEGFSVERSNKQGYSSLFTVYSTSRPDCKVSVSQASGEGKVVLSTGIFLGEAERGRLKQTSPEARTAMVRELSALLNGRSSLFQINEDGGVISDIAVSSAIYSDGFTKDRLMTSVNELFSTQALVLIALGTRFDKIPPAPGRETTQPPYPGQVSKPKSAVFCMHCGAQLAPQAKFCGRCGREQS